MTRSKRRSIIALALTTAAFACTAVSTANASAAFFKVSETGEFGGPQTSDQVFTFGAGSVTCKEAHFSLLTTSNLFEVLEPGFGTDYSNCTSINGFGKQAATVSRAPIAVWANGKVNLQNAITIHVGGVTNCNIVVAKQAGLESISYTNKSGKIEASMALTGITYSASSELCDHFFSAPGTKGTLTGSSTIERFGGGTISWQP